MKTTNETTNHAFIVRIWLEPRELKDAEPIWRGVIEDIESKEQVYFDHLDQMRAYFTEHLKKLGVKTNSIEK